MTKSFFRKLSYFLIFSIAFFSVYRISQHNRIKHNQNRVLIERVMDKVNGEDDTLTVQELRNFLKDIGYQGPIEKAREIDFRYSGNNIELLVNGESHPLEPQTLKDYLAE